MGLHKRQARDVGVESVGLGDFIQEDHMSASKQSCDNCTCHLHGDLPCPDHCNKCNVLSHTREACGECRKLAAAINKMVSSVDRFIADNKDGDGEIQWWPDTKPRTSFGETADAVSDFIKATQS